MTSLDTLFSKTLCIFQFQTYGEGLLLLQHLPASPQAEVIELAYRGETTDLIFVCDPEALKSIQDLKMGKSWIFSSPHPDLIKIYLNLVNQNIDEVLITCESSQLGPLMGCGQKLLQSQMRPVDFHFSRSAHAKGFLLMTGKSKDLSDGLLKELKALCQVTVIERPSPAVRSYFDFSEGEGR